MSPRPRPILVHQTFIKLFEQIIRKPHQKREKWIAKELQKASTQSDPRGRMRYLNDPYLQGKVFRSHIRQGGLRMIWMLWDYKNCEIVLPVLLSKNLRKDFDYQNVDLESIVQSILDALNRGSHKEFESWTTDGENIFREKF